MEDQLILADAPKVSGDRDGGEGRVWPCGHSTDDSSVRHSKVLMATLDPLSFPLAVSVVSGEQIDDPLSVPTIQRMLALLGRKSILIVGDSTMCARATRASVQACDQDSLTHLAQVGETVALMAGWIAAGVVQEVAYRLLRVEKKGGEQEKKES